MITIDDAEEIALAVFPKGSYITGRTTVEDEHLFFLVRPNNIEGRFDPFVKVNSKTGKVSDWSPNDYLNSGEIIREMSTEAPRV